MNYIDEDTAFERWCENNYLPIESQAIWKKLFKRFNRSGWSEWITVDNLTLMADVQIKHEKTFISYRDKLIEAGLILYLKGKKGSPNRYKLVSYEKYTSKNEVHSTVHSTVQMTVYPPVEVTDITKPNKTKPNTRDNNPLYPPQAGENSEDKSSYAKKQEREAKKPRNNSLKQELNQIFISRTEHFSDELIKKIKEWLEYKTLEKHNTYKPIGLKNLLSEIDSNRTKYGEEAVIQIISHSMANNWIGIVWDKLKKSSESSENKHDSKRIEQIKKTVHSEPEDIFMKILREEQEKERSKGELS